MSKKIQLGDTNVSVATFVVTQAFTLGTAALVQIIIKGPTNWAGQRQTLDQ